MRRVAVIGTSNIGAVKFAGEALATEWPELDITFYGLPGAKFDAAGVSGDGVFAPAEDDAQARKLAKRVNGSVGIDLRAFDGVLVIGDALGMPNALWTANQYDVVDWPTRRGLPLMSEPAFLSGMEEAITARVTHLAHQFRDIRPLHVALAPFPTTAVVPEGKYHQQPYAGIATHPEAARIHDLYQNALTRALNAQDITYIPQPPETVAQPFLTVHEFGIGALDFRHDHAVLDDHRHMNPRFGALLFRAFARTLPEMQGQPTT